MYVSTYLCLLTDSHMYIYMYAYIYMYIYIFVPYSGLEQSLELCQI